MYIDLTVVVPYYNENSTILTTLDLISKQTISPKEVIFVNSSSTDESFKTINKWIENNQKNLFTKYININKGANTPSSSKNIGIVKARTEWIAFMDCGLIFPLNWLEKQWNYILTKKCEVVSGVCVLNGLGNIDIASVSQTYGFNRKRPCVPGTLVKKTIFDKTGLFLENRRAGYDADWPLSLKALKIFRGINYKIILKYNGTNYGSTFKTIFHKSILYAIPTIGLKYYKKSYNYIIFLLLFIFSIFYSLKFFFILSSIYLIVRGFLIPVIKSQGIDVFSRYPIMIIYIPLIGIVIDLGKTIGIMIGIKKYHF
jgi:glycosyltransferase involved in cell wall biosynthesis